jgi:glycosyltransferase involved in cell wall biosynthesis
MPAVLREVPAARLFMVGDGERKSSLMDLAESLGVKDKITFTGFREDLGPFYEMADVFAMSSLQEGLGTAVLDALASGVPIVATNAGGIPESVHDGITGRLVPPGDHGALARGIVWMIGHPEAACQMAANGKAMVRRHFSIAAMADKNLDIYRRITGPNG